MPRPERDLVCLRAVVRGGVQNVGFRYFVLDRARRAGLRGWVRNRPDGSLECLAQGPRDALEELRRALARGPAGAQVEAVDESWEEPRPGLGEFDVRLP